MKIDEGLLIDCLKIYIQRIDDESKEYRKYFNKLKKDYGYFEAYEKVDQDKQKRHYQNQKKRLPAARLLKLLEERN